MTTATWNTRRQKWEDTPVMTSYEQKMEECKMEYRQWLKDTGKLTVKTITETIYK